MFWTAAIIAAGAIAWWWSVRPYSARYRRRRGERWAREAVAQARHSLDQPARYSPRSW